MTVRAHLAMLLAVAAVTSSCSTQEPAPASKAAGEGDVHVTRAASLAKVMRNFDEAVRKQMPGQIDQYDRWAGVLPALADAAAGVKQTAADLAGHPPRGLGMSDRELFAARAGQLGSAAGELEEAAARGDVDAVESARDRVEEACSACHARFRPARPGVPEAFLE